MITSVRLFLAFAILFTALTARAQFSGGAVAGMNFSRIAGPLETDGSGGEVEDYTFRTGFHVGLRFNYRFAEAFGVRGELLLSQKGADYTFDGQSYWVFITDRNSLIHSTGARSTTLRIANNYVELPLMGFLRLGRLELSGGGYFAYLTRSTASGELRYSGISEKGFAIDPFTVALDFNYFDDTFQRNDLDDTQPVLVDGEVIAVPRAIGARYEVLIEPKDRLYRRTDYGLIGGVALYLNQGLSLSFRVNYGLQDLSRTESDISRVNLSPERQLIFRDDFDRNLTLQASVAFSL